MALSTLALAAISRAIGASRKSLEELKPVLDGLDILYNAAGGLKQTILQGDLDAAANLSGLTKQQLDDALFVLTGTLLTDLKNGFTALEQLAARG